MLVGLRSDTYINQLKSSYTAKLLINKRFVNKKYTKKYYFYPSDRLFNTSQDTINLQRLIS